MGKLLEQLHNKHQMLWSLSTFPASHRMGNLYFRKIVRDSNDHYCLPRLIHIHSSISYWLYLLPFWPSLVLSLSHSLFLCLKFLSHPKKPLHNDLQVCFLHLSCPFSIFSSVSACSIYSFSPFHLPPVQHISFPAVLTISQGPLPSPVMSTLASSPPTTSLTAQCLWSPVHHWHDWARHSCYGARQSGYGHWSRLAGSWISNAAISIWTPVMWQYDRDYGIWGWVAGADRERRAS